MRKAGQGAIYEEAGKHIVAGMSDPLASSSFQCGIRDPQRKGGETEQQRARWYGGASI